MNLAKLDETKSLKKANHEIGFTLEGGEMNFVTRKIYNTLIYHAQRLGVKKKGALPFAFDWDLDALPEGVDVNNYFWIPLGELIGDASVKREYDLIRGFLNDMKRILVSRTVPGVWEQVSNIIGDVVYLNANTLKKTSRDKWAIGWNFPAALEPLLLDPAQYTPIRLYFQSLLSSEAALVLYETARRYAGWSEHRTQKLPWKEWQLLLTGDIDRRAEYKLFKRDFLKNALDEINHKTDVAIDLIEFRVGTKVVEIRFDVELKPQQKLELPDGPVINAKILDDLKLAGVADAVAEKLLADFGEDRCSENLALYRKPGVQRSTGWLVKAIRDNYSAGAIAAENAKKEAAKQAEAEHKALIEASVKATADKAPRGEAFSDEVIMGALSAHNAMTEEDRATHIAEHLETLTPILAIASKKALASADLAIGKEAVRRYLGWLAKRLVGLV